MIDQIINLGNKNNINGLEIAGQIVDLDYPSQVDPNTPFSISYGAKNISTRYYTFYGYLEDAVGIIPGTEWEMQINPNDTYYPAVFNHPGITEPITLILTLGHFEEELEICQWITDHGGIDNLTIQNVFELIDAYLFQTSPSGYTFIPTIQNVFGVIDYYLGFNGDSGTGCSFY